MNYIIRNLLSKNGFFWANINEFYHDRVHTFDLKKVFGNGDQKYRLDKKIGSQFCKGIVYDELNAFFNRRNNKNRDYNDRFIPLMASTVIHRHNGIPRVYFIGQSLLLQDTQIAQVLKYRHYVTARYRWRYYFFRNELKMVFAPYKLKVEHFKKIGIDEKGEPIWKAIGKEKIKIAPIYLETFNTHAFAELTEKLPSYYHLPVEVKKA